MIHKSSGRRRINNEKREEKEEGKRNRIEKSYGWYHEVGGLASSTTHSMLAYHLERLTW